MTSLRWTSAGSVGCWDTLDGEPLLELSPGEVCAFIRAGEVCAFIEQARCVPL